MPDGEVSGTINVQVIYKEAGGAGVSASDITGGGSGKASGAAAAADTKKNNRFLADMAKFAKITAGAVTVGAVIKQSKVMSGFLGGMTQLLGALIDVFLMPFIPLLITVMKAVAGIVKWFAKFMDDPSAALKEAWDGFMSWLETTWGAFWENITDFSQWSDFIPDINWETLLKMGVGGAGLLGLVAALSSGISVALGASTVVSSLLSGLLGTTGATAGGVGATAGISTILAAAGTVAAVSALVLAVLGTGILVGFLAEKAVDKWAPDWLRKRLGYDTEEDIQLKDTLGRREKRVHGVLDSIIGLDAADRAKALKSVTEAKGLQEKVDAYGILQNMTADDFLRKLGKFQSQNSLGGYVSTWGGTNQNWGIEKGAFVINIRNAAGNYPLSEENIEIIDAQNRRNDDLIEFHRFDGEG